MLARQRVAVRLKGVPRPGSARLGFQTMPEGNRPEPVEDVLKEPIHFGALCVADPPVRYRAYELGGVRYGWTIPPAVGRRWYLPPHFALTLHLTPFGQWAVIEARPFEWHEDARRWASGLWAEAARQRRPDDME